jgi:hypothetical protein
VRDQKISVSERLDQLVDAVGRLTQLGRGLLGDGGAAASATSPTVATASRMDDRAVDRAAAIWPTSSRLATSTSVVRSRSATRPSAQIAGRAHAAQADVGRDTDRQRDHHSGAAQDRQLQPDGRT